eukprot:gene34360-57290_t
MGRVLNHLAHEEEGEKQDAAAERVLLQPEGDVELHDGEGLAPHCHRPARVRRCVRQRHHGTTWDL